MVDIETISAGVHSVLTGFGGSACNPRIRLSDAGPLRALQAALTKTSKDVRDTF